GVFEGFADVHETEEVAPCQTLPFWREFVEDQLRRLRECSPYASGLEVAEQRERPAAPPLPRFDEAVREERQGTWLANDVVQHSLDESGLDDEAALLRGALDRRPKLLRGHRSDQRLVLFHQ